VFLAPENGGMFILFETSMQAPKMLNEENFGRIAQNMLVPCVGFPKNQK